MAKYSAEFKEFIVNQRLVHKKTFVEIEREHGVLRGTTYQWLQKYKEGKLFIDKRLITDQQAAKEQEYEFLKKSFALLKEIRSKQHE